MILLIKFILAHLLGDFFLQWQSGVEQKNRKKWAAPFLYIHVLIHLILILLIAGFQYWIPAMIIAFSHLIIDGIKVQFHKANSLVRWFFIDQALHVSVLVAVWMIFADGFVVLPEKDIFLLLTTGIFLARPSSFCVAMAMKKWTLLIDTDEAESLPGAGQYIGILERLLILTFILLGQWGAIGFLMAAKSIFRFGDLTRAKDRKLTEYILIGTLLSFALAIAAGLICINVLGSQKLQ